MKTLDIALAISLSLFVTAPASALLYLHFWQITILEPIELPVCCLLIIFGIFCFVYFVRKGLKYQDSLLASGAYAGPQERRNRRKKR